MTTRFHNFRWWEDGSPQEMLVEGGRVVARAPHVTPAAEAIDLGGAWLMPKFCDAHCHILPTGLDLQKLHLGAASSHADVMDHVAERHRDQPEGWLLAVHYDQTKYEGGRHLTRFDLDTISTERPILLRHVNGHASVANSAALRAAEIDASTADPAGGRFGRDTHGELDGTLFELAHEMVTAKVPTPSPDDMEAAILAAAERMSDLGIGVASDMMTGRFDLAQELEAYGAAARKGPLRMRLYVQWRDVFGPRAEPLDRLRERFRELERSSQGRARVAGIKIFADGAIGSATAAIYGIYSGQPPEGPILARRAQQLPPATSGQLIYAPDRLNEMVRTASEAGFQVSVHSIGDYATDLVMDAFARTDAPQRHRIEHGMILSDDQIERIAELGCHLTFQPEFLMRFGHAYRRQLGSERASRLKRARSVLDAGIRLSFSSDRPIVGGDPWDGIRTAVHRPDGFDPAESVTFNEAITAATLAAHAANADDDGGLRQGQWAEFQTLSEDPRTKLPFDGTARKSYASS